MDATDWRKFWNAYRKKEIESEDDLFVEVGKTVHGRPISREHFCLTIERIVGLLHLQPNNKLLELCCGNGLMTRALAPLVAEVEAVDFSEHLIAHARARTESANVRYICADVLEYLEALNESRGFIPRKILLGDALAYFDAANFRSILDKVFRLTNGRFLFLATNVPCDELKWNFYNTPERIETHRRNERTRPDWNDGVGRWWRKEELVAAARAANLAVEVSEQPRELTNYRVDAIFTTEIARPSS
ncbi:MAG TPA: class I SAM-dependent methyltransferase [Chthoniobacterales bacterium]|jgi:SAM-dependent methyltransferase